MPRDRDIHKIDNYLVRFGWIVLVFSGIGTLSVGLEGYWAWALAASVLMLFTGYYVRKQERLALMVWDILESSVEVRANDIVGSTGLDRDKLRRTLALINAQPGAFFVWDPQTDLIVDGRLRKRVVHVDACDNCGAQVSATLTLDQPHAPACSYCGAPVSRPQRIEQMRREVLDEAAASREATGKGFSVIIFVLLLIFFWPAAVGYALWKGGMLDPLLDQMGVARR